MSTIAELLAARRKQPATEERSQGVAQQSYREPDESLFLAIYTPFLISPTSFRVTTFRAYKNWLLEDSCYVLNTFSLFNTSALLSHYIKIANIREASDLHGIAELLWDIELTVPGKYKERFEKIAGIKKIEAE